MEVKLQKWFTAKPLIVVLTLFISLLSFGQTHSSCQIIFQKIQDQAWKKDSRPLSYTEKDLKGYLQTGLITHHELVGGHGISRAQYVTYQNGTMGIWKRDVYEHDHHVIEGGKAEIMAYKVDRFLGLMKVPTTVYRDLKGVPGTVQILVGYLKEEVLQGNPTELVLFDDLIGNFDRHNENYLVTKDNRVIAIDNGNAGASVNKGMTKFKVNKLIESYEKSQNLLKLEEKMLTENTEGYSPKELDESRKIIHSQRNEFKSKTLQDMKTLIGKKSIYLKLKETSDQEWTDFLKSELTDRQIHFFIERRQSILNAIEKARSVFGDEVFEKELPHQHSN